MERDHEDELLAQTRERLRAQPCWDYASSGDEDWYYHNQWCPSCRERFPPALLKAATDRPWQYAVQLRAGPLLYFTGAELHGNWVTLDFLDMMDEYAQHNRRILPYPFPRGLDIAVDDIVWIGDAPNGS